MELHDIINILCIYKIIIKQLTIKEIFNLKLSCKEIYHILEGCGYLKEVRLKVNTFNDMCLSHDTYTKHKHTLEWIQLHQEEDPFVMIPKLGHIHLYLNMCKRMRWNRSIENIQSICFIDCDDINLYELRGCKKLKHLSVYYHEPKKISVTKPIQLESLETLHVNGDLNLDMIQFPNLKELCLEYLYRDKDCDVSHFTKLENLFIHSLKCINVKLPKSIQYVARLSHSILYSNQKNPSQSKFYNIIQSFSENCNDTIEKHFYTDKLI